MLSGIYEMKTTLPLFFSKSMLAVSLVCGAVWLAVQPFRLCAMNPEGFDSLQMYRDSIRWSSNNVAKSEWLEKAARYSLRTGDTASLLSFKIEQAYLRFSSGNYVEAFDSLILIEKKISDHVRVPSLLATDAVYKPFAVDSKDDSLWVGMHVTAGISLAELEIYLSEFTEATDIVNRIMTLYVQDTTGIISVRCLNALGAICAHRGMFDMAEKYFLHALELGKPLMDTGSLASFYENLAAIYAVKGDGNATLRYSLESCKILEGAGLYGEHYIYALFYMGIAYVGLGEYDMAEKQFREALDEATSRAFGHLSLYIRSNLVYVLVEQGNLEEAEMLAQENLVSAIEIDNLEMQENALVYLSHIAEAHQNFYEGLQYKDSAYRVGRRLIEQNNKLRQGIICGGWNSTGNSKRWNVPSGRWPC